MRRGRTRRRRRDKDHFNKTRYKDEARAERAAKRFNEGQGTDVYGAYRCRVCEQWHIGHQREGDVT
jgi:hypothetical protein